MPPARLKMTSPRLKPTNSHKGPLNEASSDGE
jgi:hypothetical protein